MLKRLFTKNIFKFTVITPQIYPTLFKQFEQTPKVQTLGNYYISENLIEIFNIVREAMISSQNKVQLYEKIQTQLCISNNDLDFNILANIHREKSHIYSSMNLLAKAIDEIQQAISAIEAMQNPFHVETVMLYEEAASLYIQAQSLPKAQKYLKQAQYLINSQKQQINLNQLSQEQKQHFNKSMDYILAKIYSTFCLLKLQKNQIFEAHQFLTKSLHKWEQVESKNILSYLLTIRYKCLLHFVCKQEEIALQTAEQYLKEFEETDQTVMHRMWFMKILADKGNQSYRQNLKQKITALSKIMPQKQLQELLIKLGIMKRKKSDPTDSKNNQQ